MKAGGVLSWALRAGVGALAGVGLAVLVLLGAFWLLLGGDEPAGDLAKAAAMQDAGRVEAVPVSGAGDLCRCNAGAWCEGPRGGIYCLTDDGGKRYKAKK